MDFDQHSVLPTQSCGSLLHPAFQGISNFSNPPSQVLSYKQLTEQHQGKKICGRAEKGSLGCGKWICGEFSGLDRRVLQYLYVKLEVRNVDLEMLWNRINIVERNEARKKCFKGWLCK